MKKKKTLKMLGIIILIMTIFTCAYPHIEIYKDNYLYMMSYSKEWENSEDLEELEGQMCYDESYSYNKKRNISIVSWEYKKFLLFKWFKIKYTEGNICATEFVLEETYIQNFLSNAKIQESSEEVDLAKLINNKEAIVSNTRYPWNDEHKWVSYTLDGKQQEMFIWINEDGLLVIQVGLGDEGPKYIAYK